MRIAREFYTLNRLIAVLVFLLIQITAVSSAVADTIFLKNGTTLQGKVKRATGDLLEFKDKGFWSAQSMINRNRIKSRLDTLELRNGETCTGEIFYMSFFSVDLKTASRMLHFNRLLIRNIQVGVDTGITAK
jgi:sRNA-binding regulator protein Hfq